MRPAARCALTLAAAALCAGALAAQDTTGTDRPPRPFVEGGQFDRPYLTHLLGRTAIGGYAEAHARVDRVDGATEEAGFNLKRWNLFTATQVSDFVRIGAELEFEDGGQEIVLEYAAIDIGIHPSLAVRAGVLLAPLGRFNIAHDSPRNEFTDRPLVATELLGVPLSEPGLGVLGIVGLGGAARVTYEVYAVNGFGDGIVERSPEGTRIAAGRHNFEDNNNAPSAVGRLAYSPRVGHELGISTHYGAYNVFTLDGVRVDERRDVAILAVDAETGFAGFRLQGEAAVVRVDIPAGLAGLYASRQRGAYLQAVRPLARAVLPTMPQSSLAAGLRFDVVDFDTGIPGDAVRQVTLGLVFRPASDTAVKLGYTRGRSRDRFNNPADHASAQLSVATYF